jgi:hypothetical protein
MPQIEPRNDVKQRGAKQKANASDKRNIAELVKTISSALTAITVVVAGLKFVLGWTSGIDLNIELPPAIEFRCSNPSFDGEECLNDPHAAEFHTTVTAALYVKANGDPMNEAAIEHASVTMYFPSQTSKIKGGPFELTALWAADFVPGQPFRRQQVTVSSLHGGQSTNQEIWFFPLPQPCGQKNLSECTQTERQSFLSWSDFVANIETGVDQKLPAMDNIVVLDFHFQFHAGTKSGSDSIQCAVELSNTARRMVTTEYRTRRLPYITLPCLRLCQQKQELSNLQKIDLRYLNCSSKSGPTPQKPT